MFYSNVVFYVFCVIVNCFIVNCFGNILKKSCQLSIELRERLTGTQPEIEMVQSLSHSRAYTSTYFTHSAVFLLFWVSVVKIHHYVWMLEGFTKSSMHCKDYTVKICTSYVVHRIWTRPWVQFCWEAQAAFEGNADLTDVFLAERDDNSYLCISFRAWRQAKIWMGRLTYLIQSIMVYVWIQDRQSLGAILRYSCHTRIHTKKNMG